MYSQTKLVVVLIAVIFLIVIWYQKNQIAAQKEQLGEQEQKHARQLAEQKKARQLAEQEHARQLAESKSSNLLKELSID